jgi:hypothetical protein
VERTFSWIDQNRRRMSKETTRGYVRAAKRSRICCDESPHGEAVDPLRRFFLAFGEKVRQAGSLEEPVGHRGCPCQIPAPSCPPPRC